MVQLLVDGLRESQVPVCHIDSRLSTGIDDIGTARPGKIILLIKYCLAAIFCRFRRGVTHFYFVPAHGNRASLYRDWLVMALCRPFFKRIIFHWHAAGLGEWLTHHAKGWERWVSKRLIYRVDLSIVLGKGNSADAEILEPRRIAIVPNGIPDPCPRFEQEVLTLRLQRAKARRELGGPHVFQILYLGMCRAQKGLFDLLAAVATANQELQGSPFRLNLAVAGTFVFESEQREFERCLQSPELKDCVQYQGFVSGHQKARLLRESDCLCFPSYYEAESFGLVLIEALACGLPIIATNWRSIPEVLPPGYEGIVEPRSPEQIARAILALLEKEYDPRLRTHYLEHFTHQNFLANIKAALDYET